MFSTTHLTGFNAFTAAAAASSNIKSIQTFEFTIAGGATSATQTITSVDTTKSVIFFGGFTTTHNGTALREFMPRVELTNATTVTAYRDTSNATLTVTVRGTVVEFDPAAVTSVQAGTVTIAASATSGTATISSVTTSRSAVFALGLTCTTSTISPQSVLTRVDLTNATTVTATRGSSSTAVITAGYCVVEFAAGLIASVQPRSVTLTGTATSSTDTITSVNTANTLLIYGGVTSTSSTLSNYLYNMQLTNGTTVTLARTGTATTTRTVNYTALEFASGVLGSLQRGTTAVASATSADTTITSVNTAKAVLNFNGFSTDGNNTDERWASAKLNTATTVRGQKNTASTTTSTPGWEVAEFV